VGKEMSGCHQAHEGGQSELMARLEWAVGLGEGGLRRPAGRDQRPGWAPRVGSRPRRRRAAPSSRARSETVLGPTGRIQGRAPSPS
jgi:hypothetical protein